MSALRQLQTSRSGQAAAVYRRLSRSARQARFHLPLGFLFAHPLGPFRLSSEGCPRCFRPVAPLAHMVERCSLSLCPRLGGASEEEVEVGVQSLFGFGVVRRLFGGRLFTGCLIG